MKKLLILMLVACSGLFASAQVRSIIVNKIDGTQTQINIVQNMQVTFAKSQITIGTQTFNRSDVANWTYSTASAVSTVKSDAQKPFKQIGNVLSFNANASVMVFGVDGRMVISNPAVIAGSNLSLDALANGIYIVKVNGNSFKIVKK
jgi:hypothetical protein